MVKRRNRSGEFYYLFILFLLLASVHHEIEQIEWLKCFPDAQYLVAMDLVIQLANFYPIEGNITLYIDFSSTQQ